jgi:hypothetical protein
VPAVSGQGSIGGLAVTGRAASPRPSDASPTARRRPAHGTPGDRPPAVPAVSRCRARQHHGQADGVTPDARIAANVSQDGTGAPRIVRAGPSSVKGAPCGRVNSLRSPLTLEPLPAQRA